MQTKIKKIVLVIIERIKVFRDPRALGLLGFGVVALLVTWSGIKVAQNNYDLGKKVSVIQQRNDVASLENQNLKLKNKYYESNEFLELAARRQFGRAAAGEKMYIVPSDVSLKSTVEMPQEISKSTQEQIKKPKFRQNLDGWTDFLTK